MRTPTSYLSVQLVPDSRKYGIAASEGASLLTSSWALKIRNLGPPQSMLRGPLGRGGRAQADDHIFADRGFYTRETAIKHRQSTCTASTLALQEPLSSEVTV